MVRAIYEQDSLNFRKQKIWWMLRHIALK